MSKPTRAERLQAIVDWIRDGREYGSVSEPDPDELEAIVGEVEAMEAENHQLTATPYAERVRENLALKENAAGDATTIAKLEGDNAEKGLVYLQCAEEMSHAVVRAEAAEAAIAKLEAALREAQSLTHPPPSSANITPRHQLAEIAVVCSAALSFTEARAEG